MYMGFTEACSRVPACLYEDIHMHKVFCVREQKIVTIHLDYHSGWSIVPGAGLQWAEWPGKNWRWHEDELPHPLPLCESLELDKMTMCYVQYFLSLSLHTFMWHMQDYGLIDISLLSSYPHLQRLVLASNNLTGTCIAHPPTTNT